MDLSEFFNDNELSLLRDRLRDPLLLRYLLIMERPAIKQLIAGTVEPDFLRGKIHGFREIAAGATKVAEHIRKSAEESG
ncbi:MAG: hypothetical protein O3A47_04175 [Chloroflexi bacterium]|nr:hypothetical protein [Chloroflexota bacterium]